MGALTILTYHSIDTSGSVVSVAPKVFEDHLTQMRDLGFRGISLREAMARRRAAGAWPDRAVVLTFDDGYANFHDAAAALADLGFTATVFVVSGHVNGTNDWDVPPAGLGARQMLTWRQITELAAAGFEVGAHTRTHRDLRAVAEADLDSEIEGARIDIEQRVGSSVESFAYPYGRFDARAERRVSNHYRAACTVVLRRVDDDPLHRLPRVDAYYVRSLHTLERLLTGRLDAYLKVRHWGRAARSRLARV